ncbi:ATP-binding cassette domain-containing protein [Phycicoccus avicenniae]|uniref:ATP-binding cassette domain-containing protein n=1 Tax=Phycicoccus avicenniae TaxID=2828860 RepID=UPI003D2DC462
MGQDDRFILVGPNGSGKSTLLKVACGLLTAQEGAITVRGRPVTSRRQLFRAVSWMPQHVVPVAGLTVQEQVRLSAWVAGVRARSLTSAVEEALQIAQLTALARKKVRRLSGGQLRRVGYAEALARQGDVLLLDEPTAGLDEESLEALTSSLRSTPRPIVIATHDTAAMAQLQDFTIVGMAEVDPRRRSAA